MFTVYLCVIVNSTNKSCVENEDPAEELLVESKVPDTGECVGIGSTPGHHGNIHYSRHTGAEPSAEISDASELFKVATANRKRGSLVANSVMSSLNWI